MLSPLSHTSQDPSSTFILLQTVLLYMLMNLCPVAYAEKLHWSLTPQEWVIGDVHLFRHCQNVLHIYFGN